MEKLVIEGGRPLEGSIAIHGSKNAALPILAAGVLVGGTHTIENVPNLLDIHVMLQILREIGCRAEIHQDRVELDTGGIHSSHIPESLMQQMRSSIFLMGPLLARFGKVRVYQPGGCAIGERKIDLHLQGLTALGAVIHEKGGTIECRAERLHGADIILDYPSVGATENIMMAAVTAEGTTTLANAAREPEITDLQNFMNAMGADISGAGTDTITIRGVSSLKAVRYSVIPDRIVAGTVMVAAAITRGNVTLRRVCPEHLKAVAHVLKRTGVQIRTADDIMNVSCNNRPKPVDRIVTSPYPAFPTDLQAQMMVLLALADGTSIIKETVFEGRFRHVQELYRMGADIHLDLGSAVIRGVRYLDGAAVEATDLRAGAALVLAGLAARGRTVVEQIHHIDRGYDRIEELFSALGGNVRRLGQPAIAKIAGKS